LYVFTALADREKAELDVKRAALEKIKQEQELQPRAIVDIKLSISQPDWFGTGKPLVQVFVAARNSGNRLQAMHFAEKPVRVHALSIKPNRESSLTLLPDLPQLESPLKFANFFMSPTEGEAVPPILISMPSSGVYLFDVCSTLERVSELESIKRQPGISDLRVCDSQYFHVK